MEVGIMNFVQKEILHGYEWFYVLQFSMLEGKGL